MLVIGERINGMFKNVRNAIAEHDKSVIVDLAKRQLEAGAHVLDLNVGPASDDPVNAMLWLVDTVQEAVDAPLAIDSAKMEVFEPALARLQATALHQLHDRRAGTTELLHAAGDEIQCVAHRADHR